MRLRVAGAPPTEQERLQLVLKLAALNVHYAEGKLAEDQYPAQRAEGKQRWLELTRTTRGDPWPHPPLPSVAVGALQDKPGST